MTINQQTHSMKSAFQTHIHEKSGISQQWRAVRFHFRRAFEVEVQLNIEGDGLRVFFGLAFGSSSSTWTLGNGLVGKFSREFDDLYIKERKK